MLKKIIFFSLLVFIISCTKESTTVTGINDPNEMIGEVPEITLESVSKTEVIAHQDSIVFSIQYIDGDGNLGSDDPDATSIELIDTRDRETLVFNYHLKPLAPEGSTISITGTLDIVLRNTILLDDNNEEEQTTFTIRLKDEAGNWSNEVETGMIRVVK